MSEFFNYLVFQWELRRHFLTEKQEQKKEGRLSTFPEKNKKLLAEKLQKSSV